MSFLKKIRVAVLRGGPSSEYEVSLKTGETILRELPSKYQGIDVFISKDGMWHVDGIERTPADALSHVDVVFIALHGHYGEDGKVQRILEHLGVPFVGSDAFASSLAMNKHMTKTALGRFAALKDKVRFAAHKIFTHDEVVAKGHQAVFREMFIPSIVKPVNGGSSVGVSVVRSFLDLEKALEKAFEQSDTIMIEEFIEGREVTCGVIEGFRGQGIYALFPTEIARDGSHLCPAGCSEDDKQKIQELAALIHTGLGLRHYSRSDFMIHPKRGIYFLETNTLPGMTPHSLVPKALAAGGTGLSEFLDHVLGLALKK